MRMAARPAVGIRRLVVVVCSICVLYMILLASSGPAAHHSSFVPAGSIMSGGKDLSPIPAEPQSAASKTSTAGGKARAADGAPAGDELPNGGPGVRATFTMAFVRQQFIPLDDRSTRHALPAIYDHVVVTDCEKLQLDVAETFSRHVATLLGRTRLSLTIHGATPHDVDLVDVRAALFKHAPAWYVANYTWLRDQDQAVLVFKRRVSMFVFCIGGGSDGRANFVEWTWGQRTPIQWYGDAWSPELRPIVDLHPMYLKDRFNFLTFKISRIWRRVFLDFGRVGDAPAYDWYVRLWDDNYFYEEATFNTLGRFDSQERAMAGKIGWRNMGPKDAIFPFAGGGAGWFLAHGGLAALGPSIDAAEQWFVDFRARKDIFLPHGIHDEDVFLTAWLHKLNTTFINMPGVEHVSPGLKQKQRCLRDEQLYKLRWDPSETIYFDYPAREAQFRIEDAWYAYGKPIVWHYMSPSRLARLEVTLYPDRKPFLDTLKPPPTAADMAKPKRQCYPGVPDGPPPARGRSLFESPLAEPLTYLHQPD